VTDWAEQRRRAIDVHAAELARREAAEADEAGRLIEGFIEQARADGAQPTRLRARSYDGRHRYRTPLRGWYLTPD